MRDEEDAYFNGDDDDDDPWNPAYSDPDLEARPPLSRRQFTYKPDFSDPVPMSPKEAREDIRRRDFQQSVAAGATPEEALAAQKRLPKTQDPLQQSMAKAKRFHSLARKARGRRR